MEALSTGISTEFRIGAPAIAFDFDGTLIDSGLDKGIHIMCAVWSAFKLNGLGHYLHEDDIRTDIDLMLTAYVKYPGAPRFQQLSALANSLIHHIPSSIDEDKLEVLPDEIRERYSQIKASFNHTYSRLNDTAAALYWKPFPLVHSTLRRLVGKHDLYIASGVTEDLLFEDLERHSFDRQLFRGIYGGNKSGGSDKAELLHTIQAKGYPDVLFVADSNRDLLYAQQAGARFFRIRKNRDFIRLAKSLEQGLPDEQETWSYTPDELDFFFRKTGTIIRMVLRKGDYKNYKKMTEIIHDSDSRH